jgi:inorganic pyrophosphatase/exopolyphosphatase
MTVSNKVIEILNKDAKAKEMNKAFNEAAERQGLTGEEFNKAKESFLMMMIANNPEALQVMAQEVYAHHNA